jgi:hypothetical protein
MTAATTKAFLIGKSSASTGWDGAMYVNGSVWFQGANLYASSDERLKKINKELNVTLDQLLEIRKVYYTYILNEEKNIEVGTIAQDIQKICPELVDVSNEGYLSVAYNKLSLLAFAGIDELEKRILNLETKINNK